MGTASGYIKAVQRTLTSRISDLSSRAVGELLTDLYTSIRAPRSVIITTVSELRIESGLFWRSHIRALSPVSSDGLILLGVESGPPPADGLCVVEPSRVSFH